ncbi:MAG: TIGR01620 family protein [Hyphomicrobiaceae bacterium]
MSSGPNRPGPRAFDPDDADVVVEELPEAPEVQQADFGQSGEHSARIQRVAKFRRGFGWGALFLSAVGALLVMAMGLWASNFVAELMAQEGWLGWIAFGVLAVAGLAAFMLAAREVYGLLQLRRVGQLRAEAEAALAQGDERQARRVVRQLGRLYGNRADTRWALGQIRQHAKGVLTAQELMTLADREIGAALDPQARALVAQSARRVSVLTALSPGAVLDMIFVAAQTLGMMRRLALLYGGRPGFFGLLRLARRVIGHIIITGGIAFTLDLAQDILGKRIAGMVAGRLGEGFFNGALTARLGLAAIEVCRPLPFIEAKPPNLRGIVRDLVSPSKPVGPAASDDAERKA